MYADKAFINGQVITVDAKNSVQEAIAIRENKIMAVGSNEYIQRFINERTEVYDLQGKSLLPGFIDAHSHLSSFAFSKFAVPIGPDDVSSISEIVEKLKERAKNTPPGEWVIGYGFRDNKVKEMRYPTLEELDEASKEHPVCVLRVCGHNSIVNSKAMELVGIDENTPDPVGGEIERDENGKLTGRLKENAHFRVRSMLRINEEQYLKGLSELSDYLLSIGITSIHDAGGYGPEDFRILHKASSLGLIKSRVTAFVCSLYKPHDFIDKMVQAGVVTGLGNQRFKVGPAKVFVDGSCVGPNIATREPYSHSPNDYGTLFYTQEELDEILIEAHAKGFQITAHAEGDRAIEMMLNTIEAALEKYPRDDHRHRIEHASLTQPDLLERMKKLGIVPSPNPAFYYVIGDRVKTYYGDRIMHPIKDWIDAGLKPAAGSDMPAGRNYSPLFGIWGAITRLTEMGQVYGEDQRISLEDAIRIYTWNGAYANFEEDIKGSLEEGKLADLVVLDNRLLDVPTEKIKDIQVELTMIDGEIVYQKK